MKNIFKLLAAFILISSQANAQWNIGGKIGVNRSNIDYPGSIENPSFRTGINIGFVASYMLSERFDIQGELLYSTRGFKEKALIQTANDPSNAKDLTCRYNYLDIPVVVKYYIHSGFNIHLGPQLGITLSNSVKIDNKKQTDIEFGKLNDYELGLVGGLGYEFPNGLFIDGRYLLGLTSKHSIENRSIQLALGYKFKL